MTEEQEKETIKYLEFLQNKFLEDAKQRRENGEVTGYGTMEDVDKLRALYIRFALNMLKEKDKIIDLMTKHIANSAIVDDTVCAIKCDCETDIREDCTYEKMLNCTKQYFKNKVEENKN